MFRQTFNGLSIEKYVLYHLNEPYLGYQSELESIRVVSL